MLKPRDASYAARRGLAFLNGQQGADGSFISFSSASMKPFRRVRSWRTVFVPALMMASLAGLDGAEALRIRRKLAGFLLEERGPNWSFNYWTKDSQDRRTQPYPDDLDDTFCALAGLYLHDPALIDEAVLAQAVKLLLATEIAPGGPYRTWLVPPDSEPVWTDVDVAVNSNVAFFLSLASNGLPELDRLMGEAIANGSFTSPYYPSEYAFIYYFARSYKGANRNLLLRRARKMHDAATTDLDRALCLGARARLGETQDLSAAVDRLVAGQRRDGSWPAAAFYADPVKDGRLYYNGGPALTTAFVLEALELYRQAAIKPAAAGRRGKTKPVALALAEKQCRGLEKDLLDSTLSSLRKLADSSNGTEITGLPHKLNGSLAKPLPPGSASLMDELGLANLYGWLAYTIYDDFLDEDGKPRLLPTANLAMRRSLDTFLEALPDDRAFQALVRQTFDAIDAANAWEQEHCRFKVIDGALIVRRLPDYGSLSKLAERSLGHTLPPMAVLAASGLNPNDASCGQVLRALRHYLIVRQLNDDAHDWPEDLQNGHITPVVVQLLEELGVKPGSHALPELLQDSKKQFWNVTLPRLCRLMRRHVRLSRRALDRSGLLKPENVIADLLDGLDTSISDTLAQQSQAGNFLKHYKQKAVRR